MQSQTLKAYRPNINVFTMTPLEPITLGQLAVWHHVPPKRPSSRVLLIHGINEHSGRHLNTVQALLGHGFEVVRFDLRGAGRSGGPRQWIEHFDDYVEDTSSVFNWICRELTQMALFVLGHSLGGAIAIYFAARYQSQLRGLALSAPAYLPGESISKWVILVGKALTPLAPHLKIPKPQSQGGVSRDPAIVAAYAQDPLACQFNTLRQGSEILKAMETLPSQVEQLTLPVLFAHGSADCIIRLEGSFDLVRRVKSSDRILHILPGGFHEPHNDFGKEAYFQLLTQWLERQIGPQIEGTMSLAPATETAFSP